MDNTKIVAARVPKPLLDKLKKKAKEEDRTIGNTVVRIIREHFERSANA